MNFARSPSDAALASPCSLFTSSSTAFPPASITRFADA
jgi:hypothetical protein